MFAAAKDPVDNVPYTIPYTILTFALEYSSQNLEGAENNLLERTLFH